MTTEMTNPQSTAVLADVEGFAGFAEAVETAATDLPVAGGMGTLLRMGRDGTWIYGPESIEVQEGSRWVIDPRSLARGFVCWTRHNEPTKKNALLGEVFVPMTSQRPDRSALPVHINEDTGQSWDWDDAMSVVMTCQNGEDKGLQVLYKVSSVGGIRAIDNYFTEMKKRVATGDVVLEVELDNDHYQHPSYGKTYTPILKEIASRRPGPGCGLTDSGMTMIDYAGEASGGAIEDKTDAAPAEEEQAAPEQVEPKPRGRKRPAA